MPVRRKPRAFLRKLIAIYEAAVDSVEEHPRLATEDGQSLHQRQDGERFLDATASDFDSCSSTFISKQYILYLFYRLVADMTQFLGPCEGRSSQKAKCR
jgi:hypothetical protein